MVRLSLSKSFPEKRAALSTLASRLVLSQSENQNRYTLASNSRRDIGEGKVGACVPADSRSKNWG